MIKVNVDNKLELHIGYAVYNNMPAILKKNIKDYFLFSPKRQAWVSKGKHNTYGVQSVVKEIEKYNAELVKGVEVEKEHIETLEKVASGEISVDQAVVETAQEHLQDTPGYYDKLEKVIDNPENNPRINILEEIRLTIEPYGWTAEKDTLGEYLLSNRNNNLVATINYKYPNYTIYDKNKTKLLSGNKNVYLAIKDVMEKYFFAKKEEKIIELTVENIDNAMKSNKFWLELGSVEAKIIRQAEKEGYINRISNTQVEWSRDGLNRLKPQDKPIRLKLKQDNHFFKTGTRKAGEYFRVNEDSGRYYVYADTDFNFYIDTLTKDEFDELFNPKINNEIFQIAKKHGIEQELLQTFVDDILFRSGLDGEKLIDLLNLLGLGWRERGDKEMALMKDLIPILKKMANNKEIYGLSLYEERAQPISPKLEDKAKVLDNSQKVDNFVDDFSDINNDFVKKLIIENYDITGKSSERSRNIIQTAFNHLRRSFAANKENKGSKDYKLKETEKLKSLAFFNEINSYLSDNNKFLEEGAEQKVFLDGKNVIKLNDSIFYISWEDYLVNLIIHNYFFPDTAYSLLGFTEKDGVFYAVVQQPFVNDNENVDLGKVKILLAENGFINTKNNDYYNPELGIILEDLHDENVLTREGIPYFIDTVFYYKPVESKTQNSDPMGTAATAVMDETFNTDTDYLDNEMKTGRGDVSMYVKAGDMQYIVTYGDLYRIQSRGVSDKTFKTGSLSTGHILPIIEFIESDSKVQSTGFSIVQLLKREGNAYRTFKAVNKIAIELHPDLVPDKEEEFDAVEYAKKKIAEDPSSKFTILDFENMVKSIIQNNKGATIEKLIDLFYEESRKYNHIPKATIDEFYQKFGQSGKVSQRKAAEAFIKHVKNKYFPEPLKLSDIPAIVKAFMPPMQQKAIVGSLGHYDTLAELKERLEKMPHTYQTENIENNEKIVYLHYFYGASDWYIVEKDKGNGPDDQEQTQAFGYTVSNGDYENAEWGYIDIEALKKTNRVELDFYWTPKKFGDLDFNRAAIFDEIINTNYRNQYDVNKAIEKFIGLKEEYQAAYTDKDIQFIQRYSGYGGLGKYISNVEEEENIKGLLFEYYTPDVLVKKCWGLAYKYGFKGGKVLEPSAGPGRFIKYAPDQSLVKAYEINNFSAKIAKISYPKADVVYNYFESEFFTGFGKRQMNKKYVGTFDLVIGNAPFGDYAGKFAAMGEKEYSQAQQIDHHFLVRSLDACKPGGLVVMIVSSRFMQGNHSAVKQKIQARGELIDAYRLPNGLFQLTEVSADVLVFRKK